MSLLPCSSVGSAKLCRRARSAQRGQLLRAATFLLGKKAKRRSCSLPKKKSRSQEARKVRKIYFFLVCIGSRASHQARTGTAVRWKERCPRPQAERLLTLTAPQCGDGGPRDPPFVGFPLPPLQRSVPFSPGLGAATVTFPSAVWPSFKSLGRERGRMIASLPSGSIPARLPPQPPGDNPGSPPLPYLSCSSAVPAPVPALGRCCSRDPAVPQPRLHIPDAAARPGPRAALTPPRDGCGAVPALHRPRSLEGVPPRSAAHCVGGTPPFPAPRCASWGCHCPRQCPPAVTSSVGLPVRLPPNKQPPPRCLCPSGLLTPRVKLRVPPQAVSSPPTLSVPPASSVPLSPRCRPRVPSLALVPPSRAVTSPVVPPQPHLSLGLPLPPPPSPRPRSPIGCPSPSGRGPRHQKGAPRTHRGAPTWPWGFPRPGGVCVRVPEPIRCVSVPSPSPAVLPSPRPTWEWGTLVPPTGGEPRGTAGRPELADPTPPGSPGVETEPWV